MTKINENVKIAIICGLIGIFSIVLSLICLKECEFWLGNLIFGCSASNICITLFSHQYLAWRIEKNGDKEQN